MAGKNKLNIAQSRSLISRFKKVGLSGGVVSGVLIGMILGGTGVKTIDNTFYKNKTVFPESVTRVEVIDGDTFIMENGLSVRLLGIDSPPQDKTSSEYFGNLIKGKKIFLEYDRYQVDQFGRVLAWGWVNCESKPKFAPADYMHKSMNESNPGLIENPVGCKSGKLINEEMVKAGMAKTVVYGDRGELKYEKRIKSLSG